MNQGLITIVFDDGYESTYNKVAPHLNRLGIRAVFAIPLDVAHISGRPVAPWTRWQAVERAGHELAAHSRTHVNLTTLDDTALEEELRIPQQRLNATTLVYPGGRYDARVAAWAARYYRAARTTQWGLATIPPRQRMALPTINFTRQKFSLRKANVFARVAHALDRWLIETYHVVDDEDNGSEYFVPLKDFVNHAEWLLRHHLPVRTIREVVH